MGTHTNGLRKAIAGGLALLMLAFGLSAAPAATQETGTPAREAPAEHPNPEECLDTEDDSTWPGLLNPGVNWWEREWDTSFEVTPHAADPLGEVVVTWAMRPINLFHQYWRLDWHPVNHGLYFDGSSYWPWHEVGETYGWNRLGENWKTAEDCTAFVVLDGFDHAEGYVFRNRKMDQSTQFRPLTQSGHVDQTSTIQMWGWADAQASLACPFEPDAIAQKDVVIAAKDATIRILNIVIDGLRAQLRE